MSATPVNDLAPFDNKLPLYEASTQCKNWRYSIERLVHIRATLNEAAVAAIRIKIETDEPGSSKDVSFLTPDDEVLLVKLYITKISQLCGFFRFPEEVEATAVTYLKRFYLQNTVMDWHPKNVMLTALFLAAKTTNNPISLENYTSHIPKTAASDVLDLEFLVAQSLGFEFAVWHAHRALWGIWLDIQNLPNVTQELTSEVYDTALNNVRASRLTDAELIYTPSQIALAAISLVVPEITFQWVAMKQLTGSTSLAIRLKLCKNPEKVVGSRAYLARKKEEERIAKEKRSKKAELQKGIDEQDPFGNPLAQKRGLVDYDDDDDDDDD
ncbi:cyclin-like protein [Pholiota molesta]|nr:cyclin-like protein [Pholiota molesta]